MTLPITLSGLPRLAAGLLTSAALALVALPAVAQTATEAPAAEAAAPELAPDLALGAEDAPVTMIEYASFTCSHCGAFATDVFPTLKSEYIDTGKVRFIQRDVYFDALGLWAGILARCEPAKFYPVSEQLLTGQSQWLAGVSSSDQAAENLRRVGLAAGMTNEQMDACWGDTEQVERLVATYQANATADGIEGTPTFIIGGEKVQNQAWDGLKAKIDEKLAEAESAN
ncbi:thioredoxin domain-containing protein [Paracoccus sp. S-4012]|uniref:DsbA family protein n=1 Tax=Paracoccus sp. S-4012 TaxID=2665648 RepID=UPI0012AF1968|nr:DsbA family protein [Paracoccus sp. S-4012]MRX50906.1 thioredoxin domain-containing protein [Paracoccus sp. S-4012]